MLWGVKISFLKSKKKWKTLERQFRETVWLFINAKDFKFLQIINIKTISDILFWKIFCQLRVTFICLHFQYKLNSKQ